VSHRTNEGDEPQATRLVLTSSLESDDDACVDLLESAPPPELDVLCVTLTGAPDDCLDRWRSNVALTLPANFGIVCVDEARAGSATAPTSLAPGGQVQYISSPGDFTGLGIAISEFLAEWHGDDNRTVVCFDSVTTLLQYADSERVFQLLHVLSQRVEESGAIVSFHMTPAAHDDQTVRTIRSLFDHVVDDTDEPQ